MEYSANLEASEKMIVLERTTPTDYDQVYVVLVVADATTLTELQGHRAAHDSRDAEPLAAGAKHTMKGSP